MKAHGVVGGAWWMPRGFTLLEGMVVTVILGLVVGMSGLAFLSLRAPREADRTRSLRRGRELAIRTGRPVAIGGNDSPLTTHVLFLPDGRAIGTGAHPLTGAVVDSTR